MSPGIRDSRSSAFEALEKDFQEVLQDSYVHPKIHILNSKSWRVDGSDEFPDFNFWGDFQVKLMLIFRGVFF